MQPLMSRYTYKSSQFQVNFNVFILPSSNALSVTYDVSGSRLSFICSINSYFRLQILLESNQMLLGFAPSAA